MELQLVIDVKVADEEAFRKGIGALTPRDYGSLIMGDLAGDIIRVRVVGPATDLHG